MSTLTITDAGTTRVLLDETSPDAPEVSNGAVDVRVLRTIKANEWSTICMPFAMTAEQIDEAKSVTSDNGIGYGGVDEEGDHDPAARRRRDVWDEEEEENL